MKPVVTVVDYGMGNLLSVTRALEHCGASVALAESPGEVLGADRLLLPGVGAFGDGMGELTRRELAPAVRAFAGTGRPLMGICLGMQMLLGGSDEFGTHVGLGLIPGWVRKLPYNGGLKLPHIGWSAVTRPDGVEWSRTILDGIEPGKEMYFVHSFCACPEEDSHVLASTTYGDQAFCSVMRMDNVSGCQFHPEKSGEAGLRIIRDFLAWEPGGAV